MWSDKRTTVAEMRMAIDVFVGERDWRRYHTPVNLVSALVVEAAELLELFQWRRDGDPVPDDVVRAAGEELADVLHYALALANAIDAKLAVDALTPWKAMKADGMTYMSKPGEGAREGTAKRSAELVVSEAAVTLRVVRISELKEISPDWSIEGLPPEMFDRAKAIDSLLGTVLAFAHVLGVDLARELELKMRKNRERFPVGSGPDVGY